MLCLFIFFVKAVCKFVLWQLKLSELLFYVPFSSPAHAKPWVSHISDGGLDQESMLTLTSYLFVLSRQR